MTQAERALAFKKQGNEVFSQRAYLYAIQLYTEALDLYPIDHLVFSNRSASYSLTNSFGKALADADRCILLAPDFAKGYFRRGVALKGLSRFKEAFDAFTESVKRDSNNQEYKKNLEEVTKLLPAAEEQSAPVPPSNEDLPVTLLPDNAENFRIEQTPLGPCCSYVTSGWGNHAVFLDRTIRENEGVFRWTIKVKYHSEGNSFLEIGAAPEDKYKSLKNSFMGDKKDKDDGSCGFYMRKEGDKLRSVLQGVEGEADVPAEETPVPDESLVSAEVDTLARTLSFFVGETKVPRVVSGIVMPLRLGTAGLAKPSFTSVSFRRLCSPTPSSVVCTFYKCRK